jgi:hypothetical protein
MVRKWLTSLIVILIFAIIGAGVNSSDDFTMPNTNDTITYVTNFVNNTNTTENVIVSFVLGIVKSSLELTPAPIIAKIKITIIDVTHLRTI